MSALHWLNSEAFTAFDQHVNIIYFVLVIAGMYAWWQQTPAAEPAAGRPSRGKPSTTVAEGVTA